MKFFKNHAVAMVLTILVIVGCSAVGYLTKPNTSVADLTSLEYGKQNYTAYLDWIKDDADLLSDKTAQEIATYMGAMEHGFGGIVAVMTTKDLGGQDIDQYAYDVAIEEDLRGMDMILLLDKGTDNWYMLPGADMQRYADAKLQSIVTAALSKDSVVRTADKVLPDMFQDMFGWYETNLSPVDNSGGGFGIILGLFVLVLVLCVMFGSMGIGYRRYGYGFWGPFWGPIFYPHRFPGGPHSRGYHHRHDPHHYSPPHRDHDDRGPGGFGGFGGGGFGGSGRGGGFGGGGGGFGGGGFGGGGRGGGFGGGGGGFGGGGFGGGGRGGGFGG